MKAHTSYKRRKDDDDDDDDDDEEDGNIQNEGSEEEIIQKNKNTDIVNGVEKNEFKKKEVEKDEEEVEVEVESSSSTSIDMSKILEEIRMIERDMFLDSIDPVAKRYLIASN